MEHVLVDRRVREMVLDVNAVKRLVGGIPDHLPVDVRVSGGFKRNASRRDVKRR